jgi:hypothetical protein
MARDSRGRWLPLGGAPADGADGRHVFSRAEARKGFRVATQRGRLPSRLQQWLRKKIKRHYESKKVA